MSDAAQRDRTSLNRRLEVIRLPVVALRRNGHLKPADLAGWRWEPEAIGVDDSGLCVAVWPSYEHPDRKQVTAQRDGEVVQAVTVDTDLRVSFVQPLPQGRFLLVAGRRRLGSTNAEVWTADGELVTKGDLGDAIEHVLTTPTGKVWVGYFDEAMGGAAPGVHGLARFTAALEVEWLYPLDAGLPEVFDCYALNVEEETAHCYAYHAFHVLSVVDDTVVDHGVAPLRSANALLVDGTRGALIGGVGAEYDLVTPLRLDHDGVHVDGAPRRIVLPDGLETQRVRHVCRGADLHTFAYGSWYRITLDELLAPDAI